MFNKWDKAITVKTRAVTSALSSFILCTSYQSCNFLSLRVSDGFPSLWSQSCCLLSLMEHPPAEYGQHSLCHGAALKSEVLMVTISSYFNCRTTLLAASKELIRLCNSSLLISTVYGFTLSSSFTSRWRFKRGICKVAILSLESASCGKERRIMHSITQHADTTQQIPGLGKSSHPSVSQDAHKFWETRE